jgi:thiopeptide-type bacteriocin biosynthesis protein
MPVDHLTATPNTTDEVAAGVRRVLAGAPLESTAAAARIEPVELADAIESYHAAGLAAVRQHTEARWQTARVAFTDWDTAETTAARTLGPQLDRLQADGAIEGWWFLRKHPCWRLRFAGPDIPAAHHLLDDLVAAGALERWWPTVYEPETFAFGGPAGLDAVHDLFCADTRGVLDHLRQPRPGLGRRELSLLLLGALLQAAELDWFERGDVFARVAQARPAPDATDDARLDTLTDSVRGLLAAPTDATDALFASGGAVASAAGWRAAYAATGHRLADAAAAGQLHRGLRAVVSHIVIFHWNRIGLSTHTQTLLAHAARDAFLPRG